MKVHFVDQFEFSNWEDEDSIALATETKAFFSKKDLSSFFKETEWYPYFSKWQTKNMDTAKIMSFDTAAKRVSFNVENLIDFLEGSMGVVLNPKQTVYLVYRKWNLLDVVWENEEFRYRLVWSTTHKVKLGARKPTLPHKALD